MAPEGRAMLLVRAVLHLAVIHLGATGVPAMATMVHCLGGLAADLQ